MVYLLYTKSAEITEVVIWSLLALLLVLANIWDINQDWLHIAAQKVEQARDFMDKGQHLPATECLEQALKFNPANFEAIVVRGELYRMELDYDNARKELFRANDINPKSFRVHFALGLTFLQEKKVLEAKS